MKTLFQRSAAHAHHRRVLRIFIGVLLVLALGASLVQSAPAARHASGPPASTLALPTVLLQAVTSGLAAPVSITNAHDGSNRLFITEQAGKIRIYDGMQLLPTPFLDISSLVEYANGGERGLFSVAFHPQYAATGYLYVNYTRKPDGAIVVARYHVSAGDANRADPGSGTTLLTVAHPATNHNGGQLQFGPDGYLYISLGDGGGGGDDHGLIGNGQDLSQLLGKIVRIDVNSGSPYAIPPSNPFVGQAGARGEIWAYGLRNPWRFSFDRQSGDLFIGDVGQNAVEEIDFQPAASGGGQNYGWRCKEGDQDYNMSTSNCASATFTAPILVYDHGSAPCYAVTGGYRYHGSRYAQFSNMYFYADYCTGQIWGATASGATWSTQELTGTSYYISSFGEDEAGEIYLADGVGGGIYRISTVAQYLFLPLISR
jgi:glucose/arabinose dehydrogenase